VVDLTTKDAENHVKKHRMLTAKTLPGQKAPRTRKNVEKRNYSYLCEY